MTHDRIGGFSIVFPIVLILVLAFGAHTLLSPAHAGPNSDAEEPTSHRKVIVDTDMGWDDTLSLIYLMKHPEVEILGVTVTGCGETFLESGVHNALALLQMGGIQAPVCVGADTPLRFDHDFPKPFKKDMSQLMGLADSFPSLDRKPHAQKAWDFIANTLQDTQDQVTILSLGGFTNLAKMLEERPDAELEKIERIVAMGGALYVDGNVAALNNAKEKWNQGQAYATNYRAEFNIFIDPVAASAIFDSSIPVTLVPLDACDYVMLEKSFIGRITAQDRLASLARDIFKRKTGSSSEGIPVPIFDPLATALMAGSLQPNQLHGLNVGVSLTEVPEANRCGQTYVSTSLEDQRLIQVVQGVSQKAFREDFARTINQDLH